MLSQEKDIACIHLLHLKAFLCLSHVYPPQPPWRRSLQPRGRREGYRPCRRLCRRALMRGGPPRKTVRAWKAPPSRPLSRPPSRRPRQRRRSGGGDKESVAVVAAECARPEELDANARLRWSPSDRWADSGAACSE